MNRIVVAVVLAGLAAWSVHASEALGGSGPVSQAGSSERVAAIWPVRGDLGLGLGRLQASLAPCAAAEGPGGVQQTGAGELALRLEIETFAGGLRIADALPADEGAPDAPRAACARQLLRGQIVPSHLARAGASFQVPFRASIRAAKADRDLAAAE